MEPPYFERLAQSEQLDSWRVEELAEAEAMLDSLVERHSAGEAKVIDMGLRRYRHRLRRELDQRTAQQERQPDS